jgi:hypothetical protein
VGDEIRVNVHTDTRGFQFVEVSDDFSSTASDFDDNVIAVLLAGFDDAAAGVDVKVVEDRIFVHDGVLPGIDGEIFPQLSFIVLKGAIVL